MCDFCEGDASWRKPASIDPQPGSAGSAEWSAGCRGSSKLSACLRAGVSSRRPRLVQHFSNGFYCCGSEFLQMYSPLQYYYANAVIRDIQTRSFSLHITKEPCWVCSPFLRIPGPGTCGLLRPDGGAGGQHRSQERTGPPHGPCLCHHLPLCSTSR